MILYPNPTYFKKVLIYPCFLYYDEKIFWHNPVYLIQAYSYEEAVFIFRNKNLYGIVGIAKDGIEINCDDSCDCKNHNDIEYYFGSSVYEFKKVYSNVWYLNSNNEVRKSHINDLLEDENKEDAILNGISYPNSNVSISIDYKYTEKILKKIVSKEYVVHNKNFK